MDASAVSSDGEISLNAGETKFVRVRLKDEDGAPVQGSLREINVWLINRVSPETGLIALSPIEAAGSSTGTYSVEITATIAAVYDLLVTYAGVPIVNDVSAVVVLASVEIVASRSIIVGSAIGIEIGMEQYYDAEVYRQIAGRNMSLIITAVDRFGNLHQTTKPSFQLNQAIQSAASWMQVFEFGDGKTRFYFSIEKTGIYYLRAHIATETVYQSNLEVGPEGPLHSNCRVFGIDIVVAGETGIGFLEVQDPYRNIFVARYKDLIDIDQFSISFSLNGAEDHDDAFASFLRYVDEENAMELTYNLTRSGVYSVSARWEKHWPIDGDGGSLIVLPADLSYEQTVVSPGLSTVKAGDLFRLEVIARDRFGNVLSEQSGLATRTQLRITHLDTELATESMKFVSMSPGVLQASVNLTKAGRYAFQVQIDSNDVSNSTGDFTVESLGIDQNLTAAVFKTNVSANEWIDVTLFPRDIFDNTVTDAELPSRLDLEIHGPGNITIHAFNHTDIPGSLLARYNIHNPGNYSLNITHNLMAIHGFPVSISVVEDVQPGNTDVLEFKVAV